MSLFNSPHIESDKRDLLSGISIVLTLAALQFYLPIHAVVTKDLWYTTISTFTV